MKIMPLLEEHCAQLCEWRYEPPYDIFNWPPWDQMVREQEEFGDPRLRSEQFVAVVGEHGELLGFAQFFKLVSVTRLGLGMKPDLCGNGLGLAFVRAITEEALRRTPDFEIDLEVLTWNARAIRVYEKAGFAITDTYTRNTPTGPAEFHCMVLQR